MGRSRRRRRTRKRVGRVSYYLHHGSWYVYYREGSKQVRRRIGVVEDQAAQIAAQVNAQLAMAAPTLFTFTPVTISELRRQFLAHHEDVCRSSLATIRRYRAATQHLENFVSGLGGEPKAHDIRANQFVAHLRTIQVHPNGHPHAAERALRDKGIRYILEVCRSLYNFAAKMRHLPPYTANPFADIGIEQLRIEDAKTIFVFDAETEPKFFQATDDWAFPIHFTLAKTGLRPGELCHVLIEDLDLDNGWLQVRNRPALGWRIKTGRERIIPLIAELLAVLRRVIGNRRAGPVFLRARYGLNAKPVLALDEAELGQQIQRRLKEKSNANGQTNTREEKARIARIVWNDAGIIDADRIRSSFIRTMTAIGLSEATCPKSWRHSFATLLQDANVDPLIRQITLGHKPSSPSAGALGMTSVYTHTRPETLRREIERALRTWPLSLQLAQQWAQGGAP